MLNRCVLLGLVTFTLATAPAVTHAQETHARPDRYTFKAGTEPNPLELVVTRWSTDAERDSVFQAAQKDPATTMDALNETGVVGWIHLPGGISHALRYARRITGADGSVDIVALADGAVWIWWSPEHIATGSAANKYRFTAIQIRLPKAAAGEGKLSATKVAADKDAGVVIGDYAQQQALLTDVRRDSAS